MFARDRDLLLFEPLLFREVYWAGQELFRGDVVVRFDAQTVSPFAELPGGGDAGYVVLVDGVERLVISWVNATIARLGRLPSAPDTDEPLVMTPDETLSVVVTTFRPQIAVVHEQLMTSVGLGTSQTGVYTGGAPTAGNVVNASEVRRVEAIGTLHLIYSAATALAGSDHPGFASKAEMYRERFERERQRVRYEIDLDGDGVADAARRPSVMHLRRGVA